MDKKLSVGQMMAVSMMLFAMFFGAGNMIFPPMIGYLAGGNYVLGIIGFMVTDAGLSILGIAAIVFAGTHLNDLGNLVGPKFSIFLGLTIYFLIGPLFALPRTGTVSYEIAAIPFLGDHAGFASSVVFTLLFFVVTYILSINPSKVVDIVGKVLTPVLLLSIAVIFILSVVKPMGEVAGPTGDYATMPFFKGLVEGYLALDGLAALAFAIVVITAIKDMGVNSSQGIVKYTIFCGLFAGIGLGVVYLALGFVGAQVSGEEGFANGGAILASIVNRQMGTFGNAVLGLAVLLACLTTAIGLSTSFSGYIHDLKPNWSYRSILTVVVVFSFAVSNIGLSQMIKITLPALVMVYPPIVTLTLLSFAKKFIGKNRESYVLAMLFALIIGIFDGLKTAAVDLGSVGEFLSSYIPFYDLGIGWVVPAIVGAAIGLLPFIKFFKRA